MTDIDNLLPVCDKHHHLVHEGRWKLALDPRRNLTITYPDGKVMTTGPPHDSRLLSRACRVDDPD